MRVSEGYQAVRPASGFVTGDTDAAPQSRTAGMASTVSNHKIKIQNYEKVHFNFMHINNYN
jgi:hypothetical protein